MTSNPVPHNNEELQAQALYDFLHGMLPQEHPDVPAEEAASGKALQALASQISINPQFETQLKARLQAKARQARPQPVRGHTVRTLAWAVALAAFILGLSWSIRKLLPPPADSSTAATLTASSLTTATPCVQEYLVHTGDTLISIAARFDVTLEALAATNSINVLDTLYEGQLLSIPGCKPGLILPPAATPTPIATPTPLPTEVLEVYYSGYLDGMEIVVQTEFPESPQQMVVYQQLPWPALTLDEANTIASRAGLPGPAYQSAANPNKDYYFFTDGFGEMLVSYNQYNYTYQPDQSKPQTGDERPAFSNALAAQVEAFLKPRGLLDFPYQVDAFDPTPGMIQFMPLLDGLPVRSTHFSGVEITAQLDAQGQVRLVNGMQLNYQPVGSYTIRPVQDAWQAALGQSAISPGVEVNVKSDTYVFKPGWQRTYPMDQPVEIYDSLEILKPANGAGETRLFLDNVLLEGNLDGLAGLEANQPIHATGQFHPGQPGTRVFEVQQWEISPLQIDSLYGTVQREGDKIYLAATQAGSERKLLLPDLPSPALEGAQVTVNGVVLEGEESVIEWSWLYKGRLGGGGGGGYSFYELNLSGTPIPPPTPMPEPSVPAGQRLDGVEGEPSVTVYQYEDGVRKNEAYFSAPPTAEWPDGLTLRMVGPGTAGLEAYHMLPVRIWGSFTGRGSNLVYEFNLERFEPVYPGVKMQAWFGQLASADVQGKRVVILTTLDGQQYLLNTSLTQEMDPTAMPYDVPPIIVEGAIFPDETFGEYTILRNYAIFAAESSDNLASYKPRLVAHVSNQPGSSSNPRRAIVEKIELVYYTYDLWVAGQDPETTYYVEPAWRFAGHYLDGTAFEFMVQALTNDYLCFECYD